jgi:hypothetical protein
VVTGGRRIGYLAGLMTNSRGGPYGVLPSAGLMFFAFAGYACECPTTPKPRKSR